MANQPKSRLWLEALLAAGLVLALSLVSLSLANPMLYEPGRDGGFFMYMGQAIARGKALYTQVWDSKGPLIFWINALGVGAQGNRWGLFFLELVFMSAWLMIAYLLLRQVFGRIAAISGVVCGASCLKLALGLGNFTEEYSLLFTLGALAAFAWLLYKPQARFWPFVLIAGSTLLSFLLRANNIATQFIAAALALAFVGQKGGVKALKAPLLGLLAGFALVAVPVAVFFLSQGSLKAMWEASFIYNFAYSSAGGEKARSLAFIRASLLPGLRLFKGWSWFIVLGWLAALWCLWQARKAPLSAPWALLAALAWPLEVIFSSISGRQFNHYFICWLPVTVLLTGLAVDFLLKEVVRPDLAAKLEGAHPALPLLTTILGLVLLAYQPLYDTARSIGILILRPERDAVYRSPLALRVQEMSEPGERVLAFAGQAGINVIAERPSIDAALFYPAINDSPVGLKVQEQYFKTLQAQMPRLILDGYKIYPQQIPAIDPEKRAEQDFQVGFSSNLAEVLDWINLHYNAIEDLDDYVIYRLR